jgi:Flp pilus assembly protein TadG
MFLDGGKMLLGAIGGLIRAKAGATSVDFAMIATPLFLLIFGTAEVGRMLWYQNALNYSVQEAARCATVDVNNCNTSDQIKSYAAARSGAGFASGTFSTSTTACGNLISASYPMSLSIPGAPISITLTAQSCYPK